MTESNTVRQAAESISPLLALFGHNPQTFTTLIGQLDTEFVKALRGPHA